MNPTAQSHPYLWAWASPRSDGLWTTNDLAPQYLDELEWLFRTIEVAAPPGWESKRRAFQTDISEEGLKGQYLEFVLAAKLIAGGLSIEFPARPDIVVNSALGIEAWSASPNFGPPQRDEEGLDIYRLQRELDIIEQKIGYTANSSKAHQARDYPTILAIGVSHAGIAWLRPPVVWAAELQQLTGNMGVFAGLMVLNATYGAPYIHSIAMMGSDRVPVAEYWAVGTALGCTPIPPARAQT